MTQLKFTNIFLAISLLVCVGSVSAQQASITITPMSIDTKVKAGASYTQNFNIINNTNERLSFRSSASDVWFDEKNQRISGPAGTLPRSASLWVQFTPSEVFVEPHASAVVKAVITVPQNASGSFYTVPVFEAAPAAKPIIRNVSLSNESTASIEIHFRGLVMLTTEQGSEYNVEIMGADITPPTAASEMAISLDLRNRGNAHAKLRGAFAIIDSAGKLAGRGTLEEKRLLPGQRKAVTGKWSGELKPGDYTSIVTISHDRVGMEPTSLVKEISFRVK